jgi:hypothetical protein
MATSDMSARAGHLALAAVVLWLVLVLPSQPMPVARTLLDIPIELPLLLALLCLVGQPGRVIATFALSLLAIQKLADLATHGALGRAFNPVVDLPLLDASVRMIAGSFGLSAAIAAVTGAALLAAAIPLSLWWAAGALSGPAWTTRQRIFGAAIGLAALAATLMMPLAVQNGTYTLARLDLVRDTFLDLRQLRHAAAEDPYANRHDLLNAIDRDVMVIFVESYGRASFDNPFYAATHLSTLRRAEARLADAGFSMQSGYLTAPIQGGQSWLSHATFANGLWINNQTSYHAVLASGRKSLFEYARQAGFQTSAIMPAITRPWPEARSMGFGQIYAEADLGYRGAAFNWVTMPDQYTLSATERLFQRNDSRGHRFVQVALISSHAPWTPVPVMLPWDQIGDGRIFDDMARSGQTPQEVWRDPDSLRRHYRGSIDYALQAVFSFAARQAQDAPLMFVLGDHQPAPTIALDDSADVALHVIGPPALIARISDWGLHPGLVPPTGSSAIPMDLLRDMILDSFTYSEAPA